MMGVQVKLDNGEKVDGYNIVLGGGVDDDQYVAKEVYKGVPYSEIPNLLERLLKTYQTNRENRETFAQFTRRTEVEDLQKLMTEQTLSIAS